VSTATIAEERVADGGKWCNAHAPAGWWNLVDLDLLDISSVTRCVLGQLFGTPDTNGYDAATDRFNLSYTQAAELGFAGRAESCGNEFCRDCPNSSSGSSTNADLAHAWKAYILERRMAERDSVAVNDLDVADS